MVPHVIEVFTSGCKECSQTLAAVEIGKCAGCTLIERNLSLDPIAHQAQVEAYGISKLPTIVIDGRIKVEGKPDFDWMCGDEFYAMLEREFPLRR